MQYAKTKLVLFDISIPVQEQLLQFENVYCGENVLAQKVMKELIQSMHGTDKLRWFHIDQQKKSDIHNKYSNKCPIYHAQIT